MISGFQNFPLDLMASKELVYDRVGLVFTSQPVKDAECDEYMGYSFSLNGRQIKFRVAKSTPVKHGHFVTFWKRAENGGPIMPYDITDLIDLFVVCVREGSRFNSCFLKMLWFLRVLFRVQVKKENGLFAFMRHGYGRKKTASQ